MNKVCSTALLFSLYTTCLAQEVTVRPLDMSDGLSCNYTTDLAKDKFGLIWVATEEGLCRFDGINFTCLCGENSDLSSCDLNCVLDSPDGKTALWIGTKADGVNVLDYTTGKVTVIRHDPDDPASLANDEITGFAPASDGGVWVATYQGGVTHVDPSSFALTHYGTSNVEGLPGDMLWSVHEVSDGRLLVGHAGQGMSLIDPKTRKAINYRHDAARPNTISGDHVWCFMTSNDGMIWVGTNQGVDIFDPTTGSFSHVAPAVLTGRVFRISQLSDGRIWLATEDHGVAILTQSEVEGLKSEPNVDFIKEGDSTSDLSGMSTRAIAEDSYGNVWVSLYGCGVNIIGNFKPPFSSIAPGYEHNSHILKGQSVLSVLQLRNGSVWLGHDGDGIQCLNPQYGHSAFFRNQAGLYVQTLMEDRLGRIWAGSFDGGASIVSPDGSVRRIALGDGDDVRQIVEDKRGFVWVITNKAIYKVDDASLAVVARFVLGNHLGRTLAFDKNGNLWAGFYGDGIRVFSPEMKQLWTFSRNDSSLPSNNIKHLMCDTKGRMWASTGEGLTRFTMRADMEGPEVRTYTRADGLENTHVRATVEDARGNIWLSTNNGLACIRGGDGKVIFYNTKDNVPRCNFNDGSGCLLSDGRIMFGSTQGGCLFSPTDVLRTRMTPQPLITMARVSTATTDSTISLIGVKKLTLSYDENTLSLAFNTLDPAVNPYVIYGYTIDGLQDRILITDESKIELRGLAPGSYTFHVRSQLHNQPWSAGEASLTLNVLPPWWKTWWAKTVYAIAAVAFVFFLFAAYRRRMRLRYELQMVKRERERDEKTNDERMKFFSNITHELRTPLTLIVDPINNLASANDIGVTSKRKLALIRMSALRLSYLIQQIREFTKTEVRTRRLTVSHGNLTEAVRSSAVRFQELAPRKGLEIRVDVEEPDVFTDFDPDALTTILDNLISNAIKYTPQGVITIGIHRREQDGRHLADISVADTGCGISPDALPHIFERYYQEDGPHQASGMGIGLALAKRMADLHEASLSVDSKLGVGTKLTLTLDIDATYPDAKHFDGCELDHEGENEDEPQEGDLLPSSSEAERQEQHAAAGASDKKVILVVEDDDAIRSYVADSFGADFTVVTAIDGVDALEKINDNMPDIVIADIMMPRMDGLQLTRNIRTNVATSHIPVILLTAKDTDKDKESGYDSGADSYITKPFSSRLLHSRVENLLARRKREADLTASAQTDAKRELLQESLSQIDQEFFSRLNALIEKGISGEADVVSIASDMAMSPSNLYRKMKAMTGLSTVEYIRRFKMHYAEKLLLEGRYSIGEVAFMVGMNSTAYFRRCFKTEFGDIPSEYLRKLKEKKAADDAI